MKRVLVVEDEVVTAMGLGDLLKLWGYEVCGPVSDGKAALECASTDAPDLALMDVKISGDIDGIEAGKRINSILGIPVILMSGYSEHDLKDRIKDLAGIQFISKPFDLEKLKLMIENQFAAKKPDPTAPFSSL